MAHPLQTIRELERELFAIVGVEARLRAHLDEATDSDRGLIEQQLASVALTFTAVQMEFMRVCDNYFGIIRPNELHREAMTGRKTYPPIESKRRFTFMEILDGPMPPPPAAGAAFAAAA
jgi:hypothetical protein